MAAKKVLKELGLHFIVVDLGEVEVMENISAGKREQLKMALAMQGLELMDDAKAGLVERIKKVIVEKINEEDEITRINFSDFLRKELNHSYAYLTALFSEVQGSTIEQFTITNKIERVKDLIIYNELSITAIAEKMNYSSVAHLSSQFKKVTGLSPSHFKKMKGKKLIPVEESGV